jgi:hypothetical protein
VSAKPVIIPAKLLSAPGMKRHRELVLTMRHLRGQSRPPNQESGPCASVQCRGPVRKDSHLRSRTLPAGRPREPIPPDRHEQLYQVAGSLRHTQPRSFNSGGYQLLSLRSTPGTTQSRLMQEVLQRLGLIKTPSTPLHPQSGRYGATVRQDGPGASAKSSRVAGFPIFLLVYRAFTQESKGLTPANLSFERQLHLPCDLRTTHHLPRGGPGGPTPQHPQLRSPTSDAGKLLEKVNGPYGIGRRYR